MKLEITQSSPMPQQFEVADEFKNGGPVKYMASIVFGDPLASVDSSAYPTAATRSATITFIEFDRMAFAITCDHVISGLKQEASALVGAEAAASYTFATLQPKFFPMIDRFLQPKNFIGPPPDIAIRRIDPQLPGHIGKELLPLTPASTAMPEPLPFGIAMGFPEILKSDNGEAIVLPHVQAFASCITTTAGAEILRFHDEVPTASSVASLSGISGGPLFWSVKDNWGLVGVNIGGLDQDPSTAQKRDGQSLGGGSRISFACERVSYNRFKDWVTQNPQLCDGRFPLAAPT